MLARVLVILALLAGTRAWPQEETGASQSNEGMTVPPAVSGIAYPSEVGAESRSNYLLGGFTFSTGFIDNVYAGSTTTANDVTYIVQPTVAFDQTTGRVHESVTYTPGFTFYQPTSSLDVVNEVGGADFQFRLSPHVSLRAADNVAEISSPFDEPYSSGAGAVSGTTQTVTPGVVAPFARQVTNTASTQLAWQFSRADMIGASGSANELHYPDPSQAAGLGDSSSEGGSVFYTHRVSAGQYFGANAQYSQSSGTPFAVQTNTQTESALPFYTMYLSPTFTFTVSGGPQYYSVAATGYPTSHSWGPAVTGSIAWQGLHTSMAASFNRTVTAGAGLAGAYQSSSATLSGRWQMLRTWTGALGASYAQNKSAIPLLVGSNVEGHTLSGSVSLEHSMGEHLTFSANYTRMHESYPTVAAIAVDPDTDRALVSIFYRFSRPIGQ